MAFIFPPQSTLCAATCEKLGAINMLQLTTSNGSVLYKQCNEDNNITAAGNFCEPGFFLSITLWSLLMEVATMGIV